MNEIRYLISDASKKVDVETHVLRYWEEELGLSIPRNEMGHRYYTEFHIRLFCQIKDLKDRGYQLKAIKNALQQVMAQNQGFMQAAGLLEEDMARTLQDNQPSIVLNDKEALPKAIMQLSDYNRLEPEKKGQVSEEKQVEEKEEEKVQNKPELMEKDGQTEMKKKGKNRKKPSAWERRNGMVGNEQESIIDEQEENFQESIFPEAISQEMNQSDINMQKSSVPEVSSPNDGGQETVSAELAETVKEQDSAMLLISQDEKMQQFQKIMNYIIGHALEANNEKLSREISSLVNERLSEELEDLMRIRDERDEERFRQFDEIIRSYQRDSQGKAEAAAARIPFFRKGRFRKRKPPQNV